MPCNSCGSRSLIRDDVTGCLVCDSCGAVQKFDNYEAHTGGLNVSQGVFIRVGTTGTGSVLNYKEKKIYEANNLIDDLCFKLNLSSQKVRDIKSMINDVTEGDYGQGDWFPVLIGACAYIVVRLENKTVLSMAEIGNLIDCNVYELGRMITRVLDHLDLKLPEFDLVVSFEKVVRGLFNFGRIDGEKFERMKGQGVFLIQCMIKWCLTTGRQPSPIVAAVLVLVAELNGVEDVGIEDVARDLHAAVATCKLRYKELLEKLVEIAQELPWGKDITVKNVLKNAPFVLRYMEMKSMEKRGEERRNLDCGGFDLGEVISRCLRRDDLEHCVEDDSRYFAVENASGLNEMVVDDVDRLQLSHECLSMVYDKFLTEGGSGKLAAETGGLHSKRSKWDIELFATDWWSGKSELSKKLFLKEILEKNVGVDPMPPSFVNGRVAVEKRRAKIDAAKHRIGRIMHPWNPDSGDGKVIALLQDSHTKKRKRKTPAKGTKLKTPAIRIDWEDFVIETLLLHQVKEEEIESGHYNTLLDLHVFNSGTM
ncbi:plant-specific TFIIB-related protein PTF2 [Mercurialis annua]|uniref:plant-specific TFIIB-related protein PTF2 n=1 Tax=Mercurialis annua TaxID=3986 RepID=UPI00215EED16|nr:plant-specific TFIIB-related protein PTF2 [Mercurialis annua]